VGSLSLGATRRPLWLKGRSGYGTDNARACAWNSRHRGVDSRRRWVTFADPPCRWPEVQLSRAGIVSALASTSFQRHRAQRTLPSWARRAGDHQPPYGGENNTLDGYGRPSRSPDRPVVVNTSVRAPRRTRSTSMTPSCRGSSRSASPMRSSGDQASCLASLPRETTPTSAT